jgi:hypothetical protein
MPTNDRERDQMEEERILKEQQEIRLREEEEIRRERAQEQRQREPVNAGGNPFRPTEPKPNINTKPKPAPQFNMEEPVKAQPHIEKKPLNSKADKNWLFEKEDELHHVSKGILSVCMCFCVITFPSLIMRNILGGGHQRSEATANKTHKRDVNDVIPEAFEAREPAKGNSVLSNNFMPAPSAQSHAIEPLIDKRAYDHLAMEAVKAKEEIRNVRKGK